MSFGHTPPTPPVPPPAQMPVTTPDAADYAAQEIRRRRGFEKTILTGDLEPLTQKKTILGAG